MSDAAATGPAAAGVGGRRNGAELALWIVLAVGVVVVLAAATLRLPANPILGALVLGLTLVAYQRTLLAWPTLLGLVLVVILFIPIRRYTIGGDLPIELEPYRIVFALVLGCWLCAVATDPAVTWRRTELEMPIAVFCIAVVVSLALNIPRVNAASDVVPKQVSFFVSFFLVMYFVASIMVRGPRLDRILRLFVGGGAIVAAASLFEWRTGTNLFTGFGRVLPFLHYIDLGESLERGSGVRAFGSAQHPIALGAALVMLTPLSLYLYLKDRLVIWLGCALILTLGALSTGSRTCAVMLIVIGVVFLVLKPQGTFRLAPLVVPCVIVTQLVMPGTLGTFRAILQPSYVIREQSFDQGTGAGRIADLGPSLREWSRSPFFGQGFSTRVTYTSTGANGAQILDDQWLGTLLEIGVVGTLGLLWLFSRAIRRLVRRARSDTGDDGWLATALAASLAAFAVGMLTFDAFAFIQVTFFGFIMLGFASILTRDERVPAEPVPSGVRTASS